MKYNIWVGGEYYGDDYNRDGRELEFDIDAENSRDAVIEVLNMLELKPDETLHYIHIGRPRET